LEGKYFVDLEKAVEKYLELGFFIIPAHFGKKIPKVKWQQYQKKQNPKDELKKWFYAKRNVNVAILCGEPSGNLAVLDFDDASIYSKFFDSSKIEKETLVVKTGGGKYHVYLRTEKPIPSFRIPQLKLEVRSEGNIVIAPPSKHPSGGFYAFANPEVKQVLQVKDLVETVWNKAGKLGVNIQEFLFKKESNNYQGEPYTGEDPPCIQFLLKGVEEGLRNEAGMRLASYWLKFRKYPPKQVFIKLEKWNTLNSARLPKDEITSILESAVKLEYSYGCRQNQTWCDIKNCNLKKKQIEKEEAGKEAETILASPNVPVALKPHLDNILAGEEENKQLMFVLLLSGLLEEYKLKQMILVKGESGAGKSTLMRLADAFKTKNVGRFTAHALDYSDLSDYQILRLKEIGKLDEESQGVSTIKFLSSDDKGYIVEVVERDEKGRFGTKQHRVPPITLVTSTTRVSLDPQFERRCWILNADESQKQTNQVRLMKARRIKEEGLVCLGISKQTSYERSLLVLKSVIEKLEKIKIVLVFPETLTQLLKSDKLRVRGDYDKIFSLVKLYAFLHQRTLPCVKNHDGQNVIFVTPKSAFDALRLAIKPFITMTTELEERPRKLIDIMRSMDLANAETEISHEIREEIAIKLGFSDRTVHRYLKQWCKAGYMSEFKDWDSGGHPLTFKLLIDLDFIVEKQSVSFDIDAANTEMGSRIQKEIEEWLNQYVDNIIPAEGWSKESIHEALLEGLGSFRKKMLSEKQTREKNDSICKIEQVSFVASPMSEKNESKPERTPQLKLFEFNQHHEQGVMD
jgi:energy-coupling factor transporter ATP-binding protein EcfA2